MSLSPGARLGAYEVLSPIGRGGMGEVYRARDTRLNRDVALKVLPNLFTGDPDRLSRFNREAQVLASLNHPNIAIIHGVEQGDSVQALVLELVEGPTLSDRLAHGPIPLGEALPIAKQICEALETAHQHGIIHRDLKPSNIKLRTDGTVKVLDFGLAKVIEPASRDGDVSQSPTITSPALTRAGIILGTAAYMAPEQATGKATDERSDIWAFGAILYEMLTGRPGFAGDTTVEVLSNVLKADPDWAALPPGTPPTIRSLVRRCLQKDRRRRFHDIADVRIEIEEALSEPNANHIARPSAQPLRLRAFGVAAALLFLLTTVGVTIRHLFEPGANLPIVRFDVFPPEGAGVGRSIALSPDGSTLAFLATSGTNASIWIRRLDSDTAEPLPGTEGVFDTSNIF